MSVTQQQPSNVNVSIRINSPGDDGPVVQINNAGGTTEVQQVVQQPPAAPEPSAPVGGDLPDTWEWVWTSACFGGAPRAGAATAAAPGWSWRWSCDEKGGAAADELASRLGAVPDGMPDVDELIAAAAPTFAAAPLTTAAAPQRPGARPDRRRDRLRHSGAAAGGAGPPPAAGGGTPRARPSPASAHAPPAVRAHRAARSEPRARAGDGSASTLPPGGEGPAFGAATALGTVASLLLGIWFAVLVTASVLVLPRLRHRRWSGLTRWLTRLPSARLERPG